MNIPGQNKRECGACTLCCKLLGVVEIGKRDGVWCEHASKGHGCAIYSERPSACRAFECFYLDRRLGLPRPDRAHAVLASHNSTRGALEVYGAEIGAGPILTVHCDPGWPNAHRDPSIQAFIARWPGPVVRSIARNDAARVTILRRGPSEQ